jgi:prolyl-tRNA synthetase
MECNCLKCQGKLEKVNTIEVGHIFKLGTKYSVSMGANFLDANGKLQPVIMGCYGIGVSRLISAVIEQNNDKDGIIWPKELAPYDLIITALDTTDTNIMDLALKIYQDLEGLNINVLFDDRDERAGVKFKDADLLGIPLQLIIGKNALKDGSLELKDRITQEKIIKPNAEILAEIKRRVNG